MKIPELLAPAGDFPSVDAALSHGADAIYAGIGKFNLRAHAPNFTIEDIPELLERIHGNKKKIYLTLNTMPDSRTLAEIEQFLRRLAAIYAVPDAFIVSDPGIIDLCQAIVPDVPMHLSTQTGTFNYRSLCFWKKQGIKRAVLPRELSLEQIAELAHHHTMETEIFIHGAMCVSVAGRCLMGAYMVQRHPNQGDCPQPCRWKYRIYADSTNSSSKMQASSIDIEETGDETYLLNSKDLCTIGLLPEILACGVTALKIEGRNKSAYYVGTVVKAYRAALDTLRDNPEEYTVLPEWSELLNAVDHRPYTTGFYKKELLLQEIFTAKATSSTRIIGIVKASLPDGASVIDVKNSFSLDETIEVLPVNQSKSPFRLVGTRLTDFNGNDVERPPSNRLLIIQGECRLQPGDMLRRKVTGSSR